MRGLKLLGLGLLLCAGTASAELSGTVTIVNDYDFRSISQSAKDPALQGSVDWADDSGFYVGAWGSNVDFDSESDFEIDAYVGFAGGEKEGLGYDFGIAYYTYWPDDDDINYPEVYAGISYDMFDAKIWYSNDYVNSSESAWYLECNASIGLPVEGLSLKLHAGYSFGDAWDALGDALGVDGEYIDYSIGLGYTYGHFDFEVKYVDTDGDIEITSDVSNNEGRAILSVSTTFPWSDE